MMNEPHKKSWFWNIKQQIIKRKIVVLNEIDTKKYINKRNEDEWTKFISMLSMTKTNNKENNDDV